MNKVGVDCACVLGRADGYYSLCPLHRAAPELLEALKELANAVGTSYMGYCDERIWRAAVDVACRARSIITKAEGGDS